MKQFLINLGDGVSSLVDEYPLLSMYAILAWIALTVALVVAHIVR